MKHGKSSFRHESLQDRKSIRAILKAMLDGIDRGKLSFSTADDAIVIEANGKQILWPWELCDYRNSSYPTPTYS